VSIIRARQAGLRGLGAGRQPRVLRTLRAL